LQLSRRIEKLQLLAPRRLYQL